MRPEEFPYGDGGVGGGLKAGADNSMAPPTCINAGRRLLSVRKHWHRKPPMVPAISLEPAGADTVPLSRFQQVGAGRSLQLPPRMQTGGRLPRESDEPNIR